MSSVVQFSVGASVHIFMSILKLHNQVYAA